MFIFANERSFVNQRTMQLPHYIQGQWVKPSQEEFVQRDASTGALIGACSTAGLDFADILAYGRQVGGPALRKLTFQERGLMLKRLALYLNERRQNYYPLSYQTGATKADSWVDIDGGIGTLFAYASLRRQLGDQPWYVDGEMVRLSKEGTFVGTHVLVPRQGVAVHINAFNFPIWGMLEKVAVNLLAGMPAVVKPSEITSFLTEAMVRDIVASGILPAGSLQLLQGSFGQHGAQAQGPPAHPPRSRALQYGGRQPERRHPGPGCGAGNPGV
jgi:oxepin-CoA hydrolase / 3-oxo-5,6-dehydrosuberyl-CoA semialdehyde dehydrogenase